LETLKVTPPGFPMVKTLAIVAFVTNLVQPALNVAFVFIQPERSPLTEFNSDYALGRLGWLWQLGAVAAGISPLAGAASFRLSLAPGKRVRLLVGLLTVTGLGVIGTGLFISGDPLHDVFGLLALAGIVISTFVARGVFARDSRWQPLARLTRWIAWYNVFILPAMIVAPLSVAGLVERAAVLPFLFWWALVFWRMYKLGSVPPGLQASHESVQQSVR